MKKTILILGSLLAGIISFAGQSTQTVRSIANQKMPTCYAVVHRDNVVLLVYSKDCMSALTAAQFMYVGSNSGLPVFDNIPLRSDFILP